MHVHAVVDRAPSELHLLQSLTVSYSFHPRVRGYRSERLSPIRHEQAHLSEELGVLQSPYVLGLEHERGVPN